MEQQLLQNEPKDWLTTLLLSIFLGVLGIHRFIQVIQRLE